MGYDSAKYRGLVTDEWDAESQRLAALPYDEFLVQPAVPTLAKFVDTDDVDIVSWDEAYEISCKVFRAQPEIPRARFAK